MRKFISFAALCAAFVSIASANVSAQSVKIIVNSANAVSELPRDEVTSLFLKKSSKFPGGAAAVPVDQAKGSATRAAFASSILGKTVAALDSYWQQQIFGGGELPPAAKASDDDVVAFVKATPGAIGYVSAGASVAGVKVVAVK